MLLINLMTKGLDKSQDLEAIDVLTDRILTILEESRLEQSLGHAKKTLSWLVRLYPQYKNDLAMKMAVLGHDLSDCKDEWRAAPEEFPDERERKKEHAERSALIMEELMGEVGLESDFIERVEHLVANHEYAVDNDTTCLMFAEVLAFLSYNLPFYLRQKGVDGTREKVQRMIEKLSPVLVESVKSYFGWGKLDVDPESCSVEERAELHSVVSNVLGKFSDLDYTESDERPSWSYNDTFVARTRTSTLEVMPSGGGEVSSVRREIILHIWSVLFDDDRDDGGYGERKILAFLSVFGQEIGAVPGLAEVLEEYDETNKQGFLHSGNGAIRVELSVVDGFMRFLREKGYDVRFPGEGDLPIGSEEDPEPMDDRRG